MPKIYNIAVELRSQYDIKAVPEFNPPPSPVNHGTQHPPAYEEDKHTCNVYIPVYPGSQFWIRYEVSPPIPDTQFVLFKLFIDGAPIVSWSCGEKEKWKGKTMYALFEGADALEGRKYVEKRALSFSSLNKKKGEPKDNCNGFDSSAYIEIRVHRASGRKRIPRELERFGEGTSQAKSGQGVDLVGAGRAGGKNPKRFYKFALIDPTDEPFAVIRYHYRTLNQLEELGFFNREESAGSILEREESSNFSLSNYYLMPNAPYSLETGNIDVQTALETLNLAREGNDTMSSFHSEDVPFSTENSDGMLSVIHEAEEESSYVLGRSAASPKKKQYRLSIPPSVKLTPTASNSNLQGVFPIPRKSDASSSMYLQPYTPYPSDEWRQRTPSPVQSRREGLSTPPLCTREEKKSGIVSTIAHAWKKKRTTVRSQSCKRRRCRIIWLICFKDKHQNKDGDKGSE